MIYVRPFGRTSNGNETQLFIIENGTSTVYVTDYGARIVALAVQDKNGVLTDVVAGFDNVADYEKNGFLIGLTPDFLNNKLFNTFVNGNSVTMGYITTNVTGSTSVKLEFKIKYTLTDENSLRIESSLLCDDDIVINFKNRSYFNLNGIINETNINDLLLSINADKFLDTGNDSQKTNTLKSVNDTPFDFRNSSLIEKAFNDEFLPFKTSGGIEHSFLIEKISDDFRKAFDLLSTDTGIYMECFTDSPLIHISTVNSLKNPFVGKFGTVFSNHSVISFEPEILPDMLTYENKKEFKSVTEYRFSIKQ